MPEEHPFLWECWYCAMYDKQTQYCRSTQLSVSKEPTDWCGKFYPINGECYTVVGDGVVNFRVGKTAEDERERRRLEEFQIAEES